MKRYNSLFIDLDDTLLDYSGDETKAIKSTFENNGLDFSDDVIELYNEIEVWHSFELGKEINAKTIVSNKFVQLLKMLEFKNSETSRLTDYFYNLMQKSHKVKSGAIKVLKTLKEKGYHIYLTTNGFPDFQYERIRSSKILKYLDGIFISEEIDLRKPSRGYFEYVIKHIPESNLSRILVIGDAPAADIFGGINSKLDTCWLNEKNYYCKYKPTYTIKSITELLDIL